MSILIFDENPNLEKVGTTFSGSPYFSLEALGHRAEAHNPDTKMLAAVIEGSIIGILSWEVPHRSGILKIGMVEVHPDYRRKGIGPELLLRAEERVKGTGVYSAVGYLNDARNMNSIRMFQSAGYTQKDAQKFYKNF